MTAVEHQGESPVIPRAELSFLHLEAQSDEEVLEALARRAEEAGWVTPTFAAALREREAAYPTGLPTPIPVAIPHADVEHVLRSGLGIATLAAPVAFGEMGGSGERVAARVVVLILVTDPKDQVDLLTRLIGLFQQPGWFDAVDAASDVDDLVRIFSDLLQEAL